MEAEDQWKRDEEERIRKEEEAEAAKIAAEKAAKKAIKQAKIDKINEIKAKGNWLSKAQLEQKAIAEARRQQLVEAGVLPASHADDEDAAEQKTSVMKRERKAKKAKEAD